VFYVVIRRESKTLLPLSSFFPTFLDKDFNDQYFFIEMYHYLLSHAFNVEKPFHTPSIIKIQIKTQFYLFIFWWYWDLNSGLCSPSCVFL
jgi:hypothetical protein